MLHSNEGTGRIFDEIFDLHGLLTQKLTGLYVDWKILNILLK